MEIIQNKSSELLKEIMHAFVTKILILLLLLLLLLSNSLLYSQSFSEVQKIVNEERRFGRFGNVVAIDGEYAAISGYYPNQIYNSVSILKRINTGKKVVFTPTKAKLLIAVIV
jgi:hypothetical protein